MTKALIIALTLLTAACAAAVERPPCALDTSAVYTVTRVPDGRPQVGTLDSLLGECATAPAWQSSCNTDVLTYTCGATVITYTVIDANASGYHAVIASDSGADELFIAEGGTP